MRICTLHTFRLDSANHLPFPVARILNLQPGMKLHPPIHAGFLYNKLKPLIYVSNDAGANGGC